MRGVAAIFAGLWLALGGVGTVSADPLGRSLRPIERPQISSSVVVQNAARLVSPDLGQAILRDVAARVQVARVADGLGRSLRPMARPDSGPSTLTNKASRQPKRGSVCGDRSLRGEEVGRVPGKLRGCGVKNAIRLREVAGVTLSQPSVMECGTAKALKKWVENGLKPAVGRTGGGVSSLTIYGHYVCRTRNHRKGAKISEHGKGKAIDIGAIKLQNGQSLSVLKDWNKRREGRILKKAHRAACGPFGTVLGPDADKYHKDHFHFDTARHRSGSYCR